MPFTTTVSNADGTPAVVFHAATQAQADENATYTSTCVLRFDSMPLEVIQSMPKSGVPGMAMELGRYIAMEEAIHLAATSDEDWSQLRQSILLLRDNSGIVH